jgi:hypothetical protein
MMRRSRWPIHSTANPSNVAAEKQTTPHVLTVQAPSHRLEHIVNRYLRRLLNSSVTAS